MMYEELLKSKRLIKSKLEPYGFKANGDVWTYECSIMDGDFYLTVNVSSDGSIDTALMETATEEEYVLYKTKAQGAFLGEIRLQIGAIIESIISSCYESAIFCSRQAEMLTEYIRDRYGRALEFLWDKLPEAAIWRRGDNEKWFGILMKVSRRKVDGSDIDDIVEVIDLRMDKEEKENILARDGYFPGWHMNKDSWFTIILDGTVPDDELIEQTDRSFYLAGGKNSYEKIYDVVRRIPEGKVATYGQIARLAGNSKWSRVVGYALHVNPEPGVIPCHRVVNSKGEPSPAFAFGGENRQIGLLEAEGVSFVDGHVDMKKFLWEE